MTELDPVPATDPPAKPTFGEYREWLWSVHGVAIGPDVSSEYATVSDQLAREFRGSSFWGGLPDRLEAVAADYRVARGVALFPRSAKRLPDLDVKSWDTFFEKTYRLNIHSNGAWERPPSRGWVLPGTWFEKVGDIVRTRFVVKYLDGAPLLGGAIAAAASDAGHGVTIGRLAKEEGYYATHVDIDFPIAVPTGLDVVSVATRVEIQIATELQDNVYDLAHRVYATRRMSDQEPDWRWNYRTDEFAANYLGHVLHYLEGMIMRIHEAPDEGNP